MNENNIVLIGLMGAGKTSAGREIAKLTGFEFIDIDDVIEQRAEMKISEIFAQKGEKCFRQLEIDTIKEFSENNRQVISTGGGAPEKITNLANLKTNGTLYYLYAPVEELFKRLSSEMDNRPMLFEDNPQQKLLYLLNKREQYYLQSDYKVDTVNRRLSEIAQEIIYLHNGGQHGS